MPDVLGAVEHPEGQAGEEVPGAEVPRHRPHLEARLPPEIGVEVLQLGDVILPVLAKPLELFPVVKKRFTGIPGRIHLNVLFFSIPIVSNLM